MFIILAEDLLKPFYFFQDGELPLVYLVSIYDDHALLSLSKDLGQSDHCKDVRIYNIP